MAAVQLFFLVLAIAYLVARSIDSVPGGRSGYRSFGAARRYRRRRW